MLQLKSRQSDNMLKEPHTTSIHTTEEFLKGMKLITSAEFFWSLYTQTLIRALFIETTLNNDTFHSPAKSVFSVFFVWANKIRRANLNIVRLFGDLKRERIKKRNNLFFNRQSSEETTLNNDTVLTFHSPRESIDSVFFVRANKVRLFGDFKRERIAAHCFSCLSIWCCQRLQVLRDEVSGSSARMAGDAQAL